MSTAWAAKAGLQGVQGQAPLLLISHQTPTFPAALVQSSLNNVQTSPSLDTAAPWQQASKNSLSQTLKSQIPFHQI